jgi:chaperonin cofactor prefoldin
VGRRRVGERNTGPEVTSGDQPAPAPPGDDPWIAVAEGAAASQRDLRALADKLAPADPTDLDRALQRASDERREAAFTHLLFARLHLGHALQAEVLRRGAGLLPSVDALAAASGRLGGAVGAVLVDVVRSGQLGWEREPTALLVATLWSRRREVPLPPGLIAQARIRARRQLTQEGEDAVLALQGLLDDPDLGALAASLDHVDVKDAARALTSRLVDRLLGEPLAAFPERPQRETVAKAPVRRAVQKVGRNDACPCGSGKKYKQCHEAADRARLSESSDVAGLTSTELARDLERHLTPERLDGLRGPALARLEPTRIPIELRTLWIDLLGRWGEDDAAERAIRAWWPGFPALDGPLGPGSPALDGPAGEVDALLDDLVRRVIEHAVRNERLEVARRLVTLRGGATEDLLVEARLGLCDPAGRLELLERLAAQDVDQGGVELGFGLMACGLRALGIHVARAELVLRSAEADGEGLYATLLETRDELLLPPWDPIDDVLYTLEHGVTPDVQRELAVARGRVDQSESSLQATRDALESLREELERREAEARQVPPPQPGAEASGAAVAPVVDDTAVRELRERLEHLKGELKDRHRERNALRRELDDTRAQVADLERTQREEVPEVEEDEDDEVDDLDASVAARIRVPVLPEGFGERLRVVPEATARAALVRLGELCAGFDTAFREVRPLRGFDGIWRVKIGRSYRLLFKPLEHTLEVVDLLHRQDLEKRLFRLRRSGEG